MKYEFIEKVNEFIDVKKLDKSGSTLKSYCLSIDKFFDFLKVQTFEDVANITPGNCRAYQNFLMESGTAKNSINAYIRPLKVMFNFFVENEYVANNPLAKVKALKISKKIPDQ